MSNQEQLIQNALNTLEQVRLRLGQAAYSKRLPDAPLLTQLANAVEHAKQQVQALRSTLKEHSK